MGSGGAGTRTVLFTDMVGSTALRTRIGEDAFDRVRHAHDEALRTAIEGGGGRVVKLTGDGVMAVFDGAGDAVGTAIDIQRRFEQLGRSSEHPLEVRVGLSLGDAVVEAGDVHGIAVVEAARLCAAAAPGQILCAEVVRAAAGSRGKFEFSSIRPLALRGIPEPLMVCDVGWEPAAAAAVWPSFAVLGPLVVAAESGVVDLPRQMERRVLLMLLAHAGEAVSVDRLIDGLWGDAPPKSAERTVHAYIARLRRLLEPDRARGAEPTVLMTAGRAYRLELATSQLDALRFEHDVEAGARLWDDGDVSGARECAARALELWRGEPYVEIADTDAGRVEHRRLVELHAVALEQRIDCDLALGPAPALVAELDGLVAQYPFRERLWSQLMLALYRAGRQADALQTFQRARRALVDELGVEPGPELRELEAAVLAQDPTLLAPAGRRVGTEPRRDLPIALEAVGPALVGRDAELAALDAAWADAVSGHGRFVSIVGAEGVGKTRLAAECARAVQESGGLVLYGRCDHAQPDPRRLFDQAVRASGVSLPPVEGTAGLAEMLGRLLAGWATRWPILLVLDDLHLASDSTLEVVASLTAWCQDMPVLVLGLFRSDSVPSDHPGNGPGRLTLGPVDRTAVSRICAAYGDDWTTSDIDRIRRESGGLPLLVHQRASELARERAEARVDEAVGRLTATRAGLAAQSSSVAEGIDDLQRLLALRRTQQATLAPETPEPAEMRSPYKGLARFEAADSAYFFGRERLVAELVTRTVGTSILAVVGPSGSGKSSLVRAGFLPALASGVLPTRGEWASVVLSPGAHPAAELRRALDRLDVAAPGRVVFVDQFEETFTVCSDRPERDAFADELAALASEPDSLVLLAVRADQFGAIADHARLAAAVNGNDVLVGPMRDDELRRAIELPARSAGLRLEPGFADEVVADVTGRAGALPLLSTALFETWLRRRDGELTLEAYRASGGVLGSVARLAEDAYMGLTAAQQDAARRLFLRLAEPVDGHDPATRAVSVNPRRIATDQIAAADDVAAWAALERLAARRLLAIDGGSVGLAHEALLREWPRLRQWLEADREGHVVHRQVGDAADAWEAGGRDDADLLRGPRLVAAVEWAEADPARLNDLERAFVASSADFQARQEREAHDRLAVQRRANRRLRVLLAGVATALAVAIVAVGLAVAQGRRADREAERAGDAADLAADERRTADLRRLVAESRSLRTTNVDLALLLALEANRLEDSLETRGAVQAALLVDPRLVALLQGNAANYRAAFSADGEILALGATNGTVELWDVDARSTAGSRWSVPGPVVGLWIEPDGTVLVASGDGTVRRLNPGDAAIPEPLIVAGEEILGADRSADGTTFATTAAGGGTALWDLASGQRSEPTIPSRPGLLGGVRFDPSGLVVATAAGDAAAGALQLWDRATGAPLGPPLAAPFGGTTGVINVAFSPDGRLLAGGGTDGRLTIFDVASGEPVRTLEGGHRDPFVYSVVFSPDGTRLVSVGQDGLAVLWDVATGAPIGAPFDGQAGPTHAVAFRPDSTTFVTAGVDGSAAIWDPVGAGAIARRVAGPGTVAVASAPDGSVVAAMAPDGVRVYDVATGEQRGPTLPSAGFGTLAFSPDNSSLAVSALSGSVTVYDVATGEPAAAPLEGHRGPLAVMAFSPDGRLLSTGGYDELLIVFDVETGEPVAEPVPHSHWVLGTAFSPDGSILATSTFDGNLAFYEGRTLEVVEARLNYEGFHGAASVAFSPDGRSFVTGAGDGTITVWDTASRTALLTSSVHSAAVYSVAWVGSLVITASTDSTSRLVDPDTGRPIGDAIPAPDRATVSPTGDGSQLAVSDRSGFLVWSLDPAEWRTAACTLAGRNLTAAEWDEHLAFAGARRETCSGER